MVSNALQMNRPERSAGAYSHGLRSGTPRPRQRQVSGTVLKRPSSDLHDKRGMLVAAVT